MKSGNIIKAKSRAWVSWTLLALFFIGIPSFVWADISDILLKFYPYITAHEEYSNNILLSPNGAKSADYITTVNPGLRFFTLQPGAYGVDMDVSGGYIYYKKNNDFSYWNASGRFDTWYALAPRLIFRLRDYLVRSDAARENEYQNLYNAQGLYIGNTQPDQYLLSTERGVHAVFIRNVVEPSMEYHFGREDLLSVLYRNNTYHNQKNDLFEDSQENTFNPRLAYWFDIRNGISLDYHLSLYTYQRSPDQLVNWITPRYTFRFNPKTSIFGEYHFEYQDFDSPGIDYYVHNPSLGLRYNFSPTLMGIAQGGYFWQIPKQGGKTQGPFFNLSLTQRAQNTLYTLAFQGGYTEDYITAQNLGFSKYYRVYGTINHRLTQRLGVQLTGSGDRHWYAGNRKDWFWDGRTSVYYMLFRWVTVSLTASYRGDNSNISGNSYTEFRGIFGITLARPGYRPGFLTGPTGFIGAPTGFMGGPTP